jgi:hypothetical protein
MSVGKAPEEREKKSGVHFLNPFSIESFHPKFAAITLHRLADAAIMLLPKPQKRVAATQPMEWHIHLPEYERLDKDLQESFEYYIQNLLQLKMKSLSINKQPKLIAGFRRTEKAIQLGLLGAVCLMQWLIFRVFELTMPEEMAKPASAWTIVIMLTGSMFIFYFSALVYLAVCRAALKNFLPKPVYQHMIEDTDLSPKRLWSLLRDTISARQKGG